MGGRPIRRGRLFKRNFIDGGNRRRDYCSSRQRQQQLTDAAFLRVVMLWNRLAGRGGIMEDGLKVITSKVTLAGIVTASALAGLASCSRVRLGALGHVREPEHARRLKGEYTDH